MSLTEHKHNEASVWSVWFVEYIVCPVCFQLGEDMDILSAEKEAKGSHLPLELYLRLPENLCFYPATVIFASKINLKNKRRGTEKTDWVGAGSGELSYGDGQVVS